MKSQSKVDGNPAKENAINQMASQYGLSDEEVQKMKSNKKMSEADKAALADKMMMQQTNISTGEIKNMQGMSEEGKKAWDQMVEANSKDPYSYGVVKYARRWAKYMQKLIAEGKTVVEIAEKAALVDRNIVVVERVAADQRGILAERHASA